MRFRASATDTTTNYASQRINYYSSTVATTPNPDGTDEFSLGFVNSANATSYGLGMRIFQPNVAAATRALWEAFSIENVGTINGFISSGYQNSTTQFDGFTITTTGTSITGTIRVYGLQNS